MPHDTVHGRLGKLVWNASRTTAVECNYKEVDKQLEEQFIYGLNYDEMLVEVIKRANKEWGGCYYMH